MRKNIGKMDFIIIIIALFIAFSVQSIRSSENGKKAVIVINGTVKREISLSKNQIFALEENKNIVFEVRDGKIRFAESDCPDKICINTGFIGTEGQSAVCLPNKVAVKIPNGADAQT